MNVDVSTNERQVHIVAASASGLDNLVRGIAAEVGEFRQVSVSLWASQTIVQTGEEVIGRKHVVFVLIIEIGVKVVEEVRIMIK